MFREAANVHLVDDRLRRWMPQRDVTLPVVCARIDDDTLQRSCSVVTGSRGGCARVRVRNNDAAAIRIEQHLGRIEAQSLWRIEWPRRAIAIELSRFDSAHESMPVVIRAVANGVEIDRA